MTNTDLPTPPTLAVVLGTFNRFELLQRAIASVRKAVGCLSYEIVVIDGGSTDGSRGWLAEQPDVVLLGHQKLRGAVEAYNHGFAYAVDRGCPFVCNFNDDAVFVDENSLEAAVRVLVREPKAGAIAFAFDLFSTDGRWGHDHVYGLPYINYGVVRREAGIAAAQAQGDPSGRRWWNPIYHTYAADSELGVWIWKLGWKVIPTGDFHVSDRNSKVQDELRENNRSTDHLRRDTKVFYERWKDESFVRDAAKLPARPRWTGLLAPETRRVLITGASGFLGRHVMGQLAVHFADNGRVVSRDRRDPAPGGVSVIGVGRDGGDLRDPISAAALFDSVRPDLVIHCAARVGGIGANQAAPVEHFVDNMQMGMNVLEQSARHCVRRVVLIGTTCSYPGEEHPPFSEHALFDGLPEATNAPYGIAKRALSVLAAAYERADAFECVTVIPANLYGEGDTFDDDRSHVIPALVKKFVGAVLVGASEVVVWGTGTPTRDFLHVEDAARGVVSLAGMTLPPARPCVVNLGTGKEWSIKQTAELIAEAAGFTGRIVYDESKPDGQRRRALNTRTATMLGWAPQIDFPFGIKRLVAWAWYH